MEIKQFRLLKAAVIINRDAADTAPGNRMATGATEEIASNLLPAAKPGAAYVHQVHNEPQLGSPLCLNTQICFVRMDFFSSYCIRSEC